jgi:hypothetical protein
MLYFTTLELMTKYIFSLEIERLLESYWDNFRVYSDNKTYILTRVEQNVVIAFIILVDERELNTAWKQDENAFYIDFIFTCRPYRNKGYAKDLLKYLTNKILCNAEIWTECLQEESLIFKKGGFLQAPEKLKSTYKIYRFGN